jgi:hypothetical protein
LRNSGFKLRNSPKTRAIPIFPSHLSYKLVARLLRRPSYFQNRKCWHSTGMIPPSPPAMPVFSLNCWHSTWGTPKMPVIPPHPPKTAPDADLSLRILVVALMSRFRRRRGENGRPVRSWDAPRRFWRGFPPLAPPSPPAPPGSAPAPASGPPAPAQPPAPTPPRHRPGKSRVQECTAIRSCGHSTLRGKVGQEKSLPTSRNLCLPSTVSIFSMHTSIAPAMVRLVADIRRPPLAMQHS